MTGEINFDALKEAVDAVVGSLEVESPIYFRPTSGPVQRKSRAFNEAIHRCQDLRFIERTERTFKLAEDGDEFIGDRTYMKTDAVQNFNTHVDDVVSKLFES